jgi:hypothetical protein
MKKLFALLLTTAASLMAQSQTLDLGSHGKITLYLADSWKFTTSDFGDRVLVTINPAGDANATCSLTVTYPEQDRLETKNRLKQRVEVNGMPMADQSVEGKAAAKEYTLKAGYGFHCDFTDPSLVGAKPKKGDYKTMSMGLIHLAPDVLIEIAISADGFNSEPYQQLLGMMEGMDFAPPSGGRRAP